MGSSLSNRTVAAERVANERRAQADRWVSLRVRCANCHDPIRPVRPPDPPKAAQTEKLPLPRPTPQRTKTKPPANSLYKQIVQHHAAVSAALTEPKPAPKQTPKPDPKPSPITVSPPIHTPALSLATPAQASAPQADAAP